MSSSNDVGSMIGKAVVGTLIGGVIITAVTGEYWPWLIIPVVIPILIWIGQAIQGNKPD